MTDDSSITPKLRSSRSIQEFWLDFLLEEELAASPDFGREFLSACDPELSFVGVEQVIHSSHDAHGECDVVAIVSATDGAGVSVRLGLLIEDKITAGFQPRQAERYRDRGTDGQKHGRWDRYKTALVAPRAYIPKEHGFDKGIELEALAEWLCPTDPVRRAFKVRRIESAIAKKNSTGVQIVDREMTEFRFRYFDNLQQFNGRSGTDFTMRVPKDTYWGDTWFILKSRHLPEKAYLRHMATSGNIELTFANTSVRDGDALRQHLEPGMALIATGKYKQHVTLRLVGPAIGSFDDFEATRSSVDAILHDAERLWRAYLAHRLAIDDALETRSDAGARSANTPEGESLPE